MKTLIEENFTGCDALVLEELKDYPIQEVIDYLKTHNRNEVGENKRSLLQCFGESCWDVSDRLNIADFRTVCPQGLNLDSKQIIDGCSTFFTPTLICSYIGHCWFGEHLCKGLFLDQLEDNTFLKMVLHLQDYLRLYQYLKQENLKKENY